MKIISDFSKDTQTLKPNPGSYEWWYFDAVSDDGYSIVIIFYEGNPFSRKYIESLHAGTQSDATQFPAISISVYDNGNPLFYSFEEFLPDSAGFSSSKPGGHAGNNHFEGVKNGNNLVYNIHLDQTLVNGDSLRGDLTFSLDSSTKINSDILTSGSDNSNHTWNLVMPKCKAEGEIRIEGYREAHFLFKGTGYHDHNTGFEPMKESFKEWYWGRYHTQNGTFIYYLMNKVNAWDNQAWYIGDDGNIEKLNSRIEKKNENLNIFGLTSARVLEFDGNEISAFLQKDTLLDNGPFYQRFEGKLLLKIDDTLEQATGISEYIYPSRIYSKTFWPLVNMRIKYPDKTHWVQKSPLLYRWTW